MRILSVFAAVYLMFACTNQQAITFKQVYSGTNGPPEAGVQYFSVQEELDNSWIRSKLDMKTYQKLLKEVNFSTQVVVVFAAGAIPSSSGNITISSIYRYTGVRDGPINLRVSLGVFRNQCRVTTVSRPFVVAVLEKPRKFQPTGGYDVSTFEDDC